MSIRLGDGWYVPAVIEELLPPTLTVEQERTEQILLALGGLRDALAGMPAPQVHVEPPDMRDLIGAIQTIRPGADPHEIAAAVVREIRSIEPDRSTETILAQLVESMKDLNFRMKGVASSGGGGGSSGGTVALDSATINALNAPQPAAADGRGLTERMLAKAPAAGKTLWLDTADLASIYIAEATQGSAASDAAFQGVRIPKDAVGNLLGEIQIATAFAWASRTGAPWA